MDASTRTFARRGARLLLRRERTRDGLQLVAVDTGRARTFPFSDVSRLLAFQDDMEGFLLRTGWTLVDGSAEPAPVEPIEEPANALRLTLV
jgi:hypothetical protein